MQWAATGRHCVILLALPGFLEFPLFLMRVTFCATHNESRLGGLKVAHLSTLPSSSQNICNYSGSHVAMGFLKQSLRLLLAVMCVWCMWRLLSTVLVVSLGWPQPGSGRGSVGSDVITSLIGSHQSQLCAPPHISHMLSLPPPLFQWTLSHRFSAIIHRLQRAQTHTHIYAHTHTYTHAGLCLFCILDCKCTG